jgi:hypothetical protein
MIVIINKILFKTFRVPAPDIKFPVLKLEYVLELTLLSIDRESISGPPELKMNFNFEISKFVNSFIVLTGMGV